MMTKPRQREAETDRLRGQKKKEQKGERNKGDGSRRNHEEIETRLGWSEGQAGGGEGACLRKQEAAQEAANWAG